MKRCERFQRRANSAWTPKDREALLVTGIQNMKGIDLYLVQVSYCLSVFLHACVLLRKLESNSTQTQIEFNR